MEINNNQRFGGTPKKWQLEDAYDRDRKL